MKKNGILMRIIFSLLIVSFIGAMAFSYAYFTPQINSDGSNLLNITTENFDVSIIDNTRTSGNLIPINDNEYATKGGDSYFSITTTSSTGTVFDLKYNLTFSQAVDDISSFKWRLTDQTGELIDNGSLSNCTARSDTNYLCTLKTAISQQESSKNYHLYFWLSDDGSDQSNFLGVGLTGNISITATKK